MKFIITALHLEAKPLIRHFGLKKDTASNRLPLYRKGDLCLAVSGTGKVKSAAATAWLLGDHGTIDDAVVLNFGLCGVEDRGVPVGELFITNKITDTATGRSFYPEMLLKTRLPEQAVATFDRMVTGENTPETLNSLVDMEASGFFQAASSFLPPERILCLKLVSDHLEGDHLSKDKVTALIEARLQQMEAVLDGCEELITRKETFSEEDQKSIETIIANLRLTATQQHQLRDWARGYLIRNGKGLDVLQPYLPVKTRNKNERNRTLEAIKHALMA